ncbi:MAG: hypothetical protein MI920_00360 [Kiloniellales bacterium]|nr:hypothetical protein [Kiloniellales bacterium]
MITPTVITNQDEARVAAKEIRSRLSALQPFGRIRRMDPFAETGYLAD